MSAPPEGPFLYDDGPEPLHTGTPRSRNGWLVAALVAIALLAVGSAVVLPLVKGSADDQARDVVTVFLAAMADGDTGTAYALLCEEQQAQLPPGDLAREYLGSGAGEITGVTADEVDGAPVQRVEVRWSGGGTSELVVVPEGGAKICGTR